MRLTEFLTEQRMMPGKAKRKVRQPQPRVAPPMEPQSKFKDDTPTVAPGMRVLQKPQPAPQAQQPAQQQQAQPAKTPTDLFIEITKKYLKDNEALAEIQQMFLAKANSLKAPAKVLSQTNYKEPRSRQEVIAREKKRREKFDKTYPEMKNG